MHKTEYEKRSKELQELSKTIPLKQEDIQNNKIDDKLNLFKIYDKNQLEIELENFTEKDKLLQKKMVFIAMC